MTKSGGNEGGWRAAIADWLAAAVGRRRRHVRTCRNRRVHVELRELDSGEFDSFAAELGDALDRLEGIEGYHLNGELGIAVVAFRSALRRPDEIVALVEGIEAHCDLDDRPFPERARGWLGDVEATYREWAELVADALGVGLGASLKLLRGRASPVQFDVAAFMSILEDAPRLRRRLERATGPDAFELLTGMVNAFVQAVGSGPVGPMVDALRRLALLRGRNARRRTWESAEPGLGPGSERRTTSPVDRAPRPAPLPEGVVERYADEAWFASLGGFVVALADTHELESSTIPLFSGLPKAARFARSGFSSELLRALSDRGVLVADPETLELLDRIDTLIVDGAFRENALGEFELLVREARRTELDVLVPGLAASDAERTRVQPISGDVDVLAERIRDLQRHGGCVAAICSGPSPAFRSADLTIGIADAEGEIPWSADLIGRNGLDDALFVLEACSLARSVAEQGVFLTGLGATLGTFLSLRGVRETNPETIKLAINAVSVVSLANGVGRALELDHRDRPTPRDTTAWHAMETDEVLAALDVDPDGLGDREARSRREPAPSDPSGWSLAATALRRELANPMTPVLVAAAGASATVGSVTDAALVAGVAATNVGIGGFERFRAERALRALLGRERGRARVWRDGTVRTIPDDEVVRGDIVEFESGDVVPFDCRILEADNLEIDESALTGESNLVRKSARAVPARNLADRTSMLYAGTSVANGRARAAVVATGVMTEARREVGTHSPDEPSTGLDSELRELSSLAIPTAGTAGALLAALGLIRNQEFERLADTGLGMAVAAVPEGLPLLATVSELATARRLSDRDVLVRNPSSLEALGRVDILCADKTGTLTVGHIRLSTISTARDRGEVADTTELASGLLRVLAVALRASPTADAPEELPHPTDRAVVEGARELSVEPAWHDAGFAPVDELTFTPRRGYYASLGDSDGMGRIAVKGAPEVVLQRCDRLAVDGDADSLDDDRRRKLLEEAESLASEGLRVLCVASRRVPPRGELEDDDVRGLTFRGFIGLNDPARPTAEAAVHRLERAGVQTLMLTGDHPETARHIAEEVGLDGGEQMLNGSEVEELSDDELADALQTTSVIARVTPAQKSRLVRILQRSGRVVAMTGDGANDAPAIRRAEIGLALGRRATDATRDAADILVLDENIETLVHCVAEGRAMLESVRDSVSILVGGNFGEIAFTIFGSLLGREPPLNARQLLLVNLLTDIAPGMSIALRTPDQENLERLLRGRPEGLVSGGLRRSLALRAATTAGGAALAWSLARIIPFGRRRAPTAALAALIETQLAQTVFLGEPSRETIWAATGSTAALIGALSTPGLHRLFGSGFLGPIGFSIATVSSAAATGAAALIERMHSANDRPD